MNVCSDLFADSNKILDNLYRDVLSFDSFPRLTIVKGHPLQCAEAVRSNTTVKYAQEVERRETHTIRIAQFWPDEPAILTGTIEYWDYEKETHCYKHVPPATLLSDVNYKSAKHQLEQFIEYFKSLPRPQEWGSADEVRFVDYEDADPMLVKKLYTFFGEVNKATTK